jgi:hypothetical protein
MQLTLPSQLSRFTHLLQKELFPILEAEVGELSVTAKRVVQVLAMIPLRRFVPVASGWNGRPAQDRYAIACAFVAKAVYNLCTTRQLIERLQSDPQLRGICGWKCSKDIPHESTFSRAFAEFAAMELPQFVHEGLIAETQKTRLIGHISRDSTAIQAREKFPPTQEAMVSSEAKKSPSGSGQKSLLAGIEKPARRKTGPAGPAPRYKRTGRKASQRRKAKGAPLTNLEQQASSKDGAQCMRQLPTACNIGAKTASNGMTQYWRGYKLHLDVADGQIPITTLVTSANLHDSQAAIPMMLESSRRVTYLYDLMDSAYDAEAIRQCSERLNHVPIIEWKTRRQAETSLACRLKAQPELSPAERVRFRERTSVERVFGRLKDEFGAKHVRVRGAAKVSAHLVFGVLALTADQLLRLAG